MKKKLLIVAVCLLVLVCLVVGILHSCTDVSSNLFMVTFESNGGSTVADMEVKASSIIPEDKISQPTKEGYSFAGWYPTQDLSGKPWNFANNTVNKDMTLFAKWTAKKYVLTIDASPDDLYSITAVRGDEQLVSGASITVEDVIVFQLVSQGEMELPGRLVVRSEANRFDFADNVLKNVTEDITVSYTELGDNQYWITYQGVRGVKHSNPETYFAAQEVVLTDPQERKGYSFAGWYIDEEKVEKISSRTGDLTVIAKWEPITYKITYRNVDGAVNENPDTYSIETIGALTAAEKEGYEFLGWYLDGKKLLTLKGQEGDLTLDAKWGPERVKSMFALQNMTQSGDDFYTGSQYGWKYARTKKNYTYTKFEIQTTITPSAENAAMGFYIGQGYNGFILEFAGWTDSVMYIYVNDAWDGDGEAKGMALYPLAGKTLPRLQKDVPVTVKMQYDRGLVKIYQLVNEQWDLIAAGDAVGAANGNTQNVTFDPCSSVRAGVAAWQTEGDAGKFENVKISSFSGSISRHTITYKGVEGVTHDNPQYYISGTGVLLKNPTNKPGYKFTGWYLGEERITSIEDGSGDVTVTAKWRQLQEGEAVFVLENMTENDGVFTTGTDWGWKYAKTEETYNAVEIEMTVTPTADNGAMGFYIGQGNDGMLLQFSGWTDSTMYTQVNGNWEPQMDANGMWLEPLSAQALPKPQKDVALTVKLQYQNGHINVFYKENGAWVLCLTGDAVEAANNNTQGVVFDRTQPVKAGIGAWQDGNSAAIFTDVKITVWNPHQQYTITYEGIDGMTHSNPTTYTPATAKDIVLCAPVGETELDFIGWYMGDTEITTLVGFSGNITLTAVWKELWYTAQNLNTVTDNADGSVSVYAAPRATGDIKYLLSKESGTKIEAVATFRYSDWFYHGGFALNDGTNTMYIGLRAGTDNIPIGFNNNAWSNYLDDITPKVNTIWADSNPGTPDPVIKARLVYENGWAQLYLWNDSTSTWDVWSQPFHVGTREGTRYAGIVENVLDTTKPMHVGIAFDGADSGINGGGYVDNFSCTVETPAAPETPAGYIVQNMESITEHTDGSVSVYAANNTPGNIKYLLTKESGTSIVAEATFRYSDWFYHGGFALNDGTNTMYFAFRAGQDTSGSIPIGFNNNAWSNYLDDITPKVNTIWTDALPGTPDPVIKARLVYENGWAQLYLWNEELQTWNQWSCKVNVGTREGTRYAGIVENVLDTTKPMHVGVAFDGADSNINGGGYVDNFSYELDGGTAGSQ